MKIPPTPNLWDERPRDPWAINVARRAPLYLHGLAILDKALEAGDAWGPDERDVAANVLAGKLERAVIVDLVTGRTLFTYDVRVAHVMRLVARIIPVRYADANAARILTKLPADYLDVAPTEVLR